MSDDNPEYEEATSFLSSVVTFYNAQANGLVAYLGDDAAKAYLGLSGSARVLNSTPVGIGLGVARVLYKINYGVKRPSIVVKGYSIITIF